MENKNKNFATVNLHKKHFTGFFEKSVEVLDELQNTISKGRKVNKLWQKLFYQYLDLKTRSMRSM